MNGLPIRILIVDDHDLVRDGLRTMLSGDASTEVIGEARDGQAAVEMCEKLHPHVVLMDIRMPRMDGIQATRIIKGRYPETAVVLLTMYDNDANLTGGVRAGAAAYLLKDTSRDLLLNTIHAVLDGALLIKSGVLRETAQDAAIQLWPPTELIGRRHGILDLLTAREKEVLELVIEGYTNRQIGQTPNIAEMTAKKHVQNVMAKLGAIDRTHAATIALRATMGVDSHPQR